VFIFFDETGVMVAVPRESEKLGLAYFSLPSREVARDNIA